MLPAGRFIVAEESSVVGGDHASHDPGWPVVVDVRRADLNGQIVCKQPQREDEQHNAARQVGGC